MRNLKEINLEYLKQKPSKREMILLGIFCVAFTIIFTSKCYLPSHEAITGLKSTLNTKIEQRKTLAAMPSLKMASKTTRQPNLSDNAAYYKKMASYSHEDGYNALLKFITSKAFLGNCEIKSIDHTEEKTGSLTINKITINISGPFVELKEFINKIENLPMLFVLDKLSLSTAADDSSIIEATLDGTLKGIL